MILANINQVDLQKTMMVGFGTATTSTAASSGSFTDLPPGKLVLDKKESGGQPQILVKLIAKEMMNSLLREAVDNHDENTEESEGTKDDEDERLNLDIEAIAELVMNSVDKKRSISQSTDLGLRSMLRAGLKEKDDLRSVSQESYISDLSMKTGGRQAPMDMWHPSFWSGEEEAPVREHRVETGAVSGSGSTTQGSNSGSNRSRSGATLLQFLVERNHEICSSDSESDDCSVVSDISGLTEVFDDIAKSKKLKHQTRKVVEPACLRGGSEHGSILGSYVNSATSTAASSAAKRKKQKKRMVSFSVTFKDVEVRQYERIMCDNPACTSGPAIGIGWQFKAEEPIPVDDWETQRRRRRRPSEMILSRPKREKIIQKLGYSEKEIAATVRELNKLRYHRRQTVNNLGVQKMEEAVETATRKVKKVLFLQRKERIPM